MRAEILVPAELMRAVPHTRLKADREGDLIVLKPLTEKPARSHHTLIAPLPVL